MNNIKNFNRNYHVRIFLEGVFGFAEQQENAIYGFGYELTLHRKNDNHVLSYPTGSNGAANLALAGRVIIDVISWYVHIVL